MKRVLMIAYHFPPIQGSSGVHRTVQFARHLLKFSWSPLIVSVHPRAYPTVNNDWSGGLPQNCIIERAFALDSARHLSINGRYVGWSALPDRWVSWWPFGVFKCLQLIKRFKPQVIWSTFPIATAHLIGLTIQRLTGLPWIADFRDPMVQPTQPELGLQREIYKHLECEVIKKSAAGVFVTNSTLNRYAGSYSGKTQDYWHLIENGYDEDLFSDASEVIDKIQHEDVKPPIKLVHTGLLYSKGRNPSAFFEALGSIAQKDRKRLHVVLRGCGQEINLNRWVSEQELSDVVKIEPSIPYRDAITEMMQADALIVLQGSEFNRQIPAKVYEYIRAGHPILALTHKSGETANFLRKWDGIYFADTKSPNEIRSALTILAKNVRLKKRPHRPVSAVNELFRATGAKKLARVLDQVVMKHNSFRLTRNGK